MSIVFVNTRASEVGATKKSDLKIGVVKEDVGQYQVAIVDLDRMKTSTRSLLQMFPDKENVMYCWYFSLLYVMVLEDLPGEYVFPQYAEKVLSKQDDDVDSKVSSLYTSVFENVALVIGSYQAGQFLLDSIVQQMLKRVFHQLLNILFLSLDNFVCCNICWYRICVLRCQSFRTTILLVLILTTSTQN